MIDLAVLFLAAYAFAFVPLGSRTGLEHCRAILRTRAAHEAGKGITRAAERLRHRLLDDDGALPGRGAPVVPPLPKRARPPAQAALEPSPAFMAPDASL